MKLFAKGQGTAIKVLTLAVGLTIGLVLLARVQLEHNFDRCIADRAHVYQVHETFLRQGEAPQEYGATPGGVVPKLREYLPEVVTGTRYTGMFYDEKITLEGRQKVLMQEAIFADSCLFDIFATPILQGNARRLLATAGQCLVSRRLYDKLGADVLGKTFTFASDRVKPMTIGGVFETFDENSTLSEVDVIMSLPSIGIYSYDGTQNLMGNDRYHSFVRLRPDADMAKIDRESKQMLREILPWDQLREVGYADAGFRLQPVAGARMHDDTVRTTSTILTIVALVILFTAVMNYILVVVSSLVSRARQVAVRRSMGAPGREFYLSALGEAALHLVLALAVMGVVLLAGQGTIRDLLGVSVSTLFSAQTALVLLGVCAVVLMACGLLPGYIYSRIPLAYVCRRYSESRRAWKLSLLGFQFALTAMLLTVLVTIYAQYSYMLHKDVGYDYRHVAYITTNMHPDSVYTFEREMERLPFVESASSVYSLYCAEQSGDNVSLPGSDRELFNFCELFTQESNIVQTMGLKLVQGKGFTPQTASGIAPEVLVDENFARRMKTLAGWDNVVGRQVINNAVGKNQPLTIVGVVRNLVLGSLTARDNRPMMILNGNRMGNYILVRMQQMTPENLLALQQLCTKTFPDLDLEVKSYATELADGYRDTLRTRNLIAIGCLATLLITLVGLVGYIRDEVSRRSSELAIRRVLGATVGSLQALFVRSVALIALPAVIVGCGLGYYLCTLMMQLFPDNVGISPSTFVLVPAGVALLLFVVVFVQTRTTALRNPIVHIKTE